MKTVGSATSLARLVERVRGLTPDSPRQWGKMNLQQMLSHVGGAMEWVLNDSDPRQEWGEPRSKFIKFLALRVPLPWPRGIPNPNDPASIEVDPERFLELRDRVVSGLEGMAQWEVSERTPPHPVFGPLTTWEWQRWAYKHADHHLKQFGA